MGDGTARVIEWRTRPSGLGSLGSIGTHMPGRAAHNITAGPAGGPNDGQTGTGAGGAVRPVSATRERIGTIINLIRPAVQSDGGDVEFVEFTPEGVVRIRLHGACVGCPSSIITLKSGIERNLREHVPEVVRVEAVE